MLSLNSLAFTALFLVMSLLRSPVAVRCLHLTWPFWKMVMELVFYLVINKFPGYVVLAAFVAALALLVYTFRITRVIALCLQGVSPFDEARYAAIDEYAHRMYRPDYSHVSCVVRDDVAASPPLHRASAPAVLSSEACSSPRQLEGASEIFISPFSSPSVNGPGPLDRAHPSYRPIVVGSVLVTNPNIISVDSDAVLADLSFDELCQLEADEKAYASRNMEIASDCNSPLNVAALSVAFVDGSVASGDAVVDDCCMDVSAGALSGGVAATTAGTGFCFSSSVVASASLVSVDAGNSVIGTKRSNEDLDDESCVREAPPCKRSKVRFTTAVCVFCCASVLRTVARADALCFGSCAVFAGFKRPRADDVACRKGKRFRAALPGDIVVFASGLSGLPSAVDLRRPLFFTSSAAATMTTAAIAATTAGQSVAPIVADTAATTTTAISTVVNNPTVVLSTLAASATTTTTAATSRRIAIPRTRSRRPMAPTVSAIPTVAATTTIPAVVIPLATASSHSMTRKNNGEKNEVGSQLQHCPSDLCQDQDPEINQSENDDYDGLEEYDDGFDLSNEDFNRIMNELECEFS